MKRFALPADEPSIIPIRVHAIELPAHHLMSDIDTLLTGLSIHVGQHQRWHILQINQRIQDRNLHAVRRGKHTCGANPQRAETPCPSSSTIRPQRGSWQ